MKIITIKLFIILTAISATCPAQSGGPYALTQAVVSNGGGTSSSGTYSATGTIGQGLAGTLSTGGTYDLRVGFWQNSPASSVSVSGRVLTSGGRGVRNAIVRMTDQLNMTRQVLTGPLGAYRFDNVVPGQTYTISIMSRRFTFTPQMIAVNNDLTNVNFIASP